MEQNELRNILKSVADGTTDIDSAMLEFKTAPFEDIGIAKIDHHRALRQGTAEVIYGVSKTPEQIKLICEKMLNAGQKRVIITRMSREAYDYLSQFMDVEYEPLSKFALVGQAPSPDCDGNIVVMTGGTSDIPVAEEAARTCEALGNKVTRIFDVGVSGLHRLLACSNEIMSARVIIAIAGMEGALASVVGGLADCPVIAVPTSVGYGASFGGIAALLSMLNSCASGVSVVNIDNGFGAGYLASMINHIGG